MRIHLLLIAVLLGCVLGGLSAGASQNKIYGKRNPPPPPGWHPQKIKKAHQIHVTRFNKNSVKRLRGVRVPAQTTRERNYDKNFKLYDPNRKPKPEETAWLFAHRGPSKRTPGIYYGKLGKPGPVPLENRMEQTIVKEPTDDWFPRFTLQEMIHGGYR